MEYRIDNLIGDKVYITILCSRKIKAYNPFDLLVVEEDNPGIIGQIFQDNTINNSSVLKNLSIVDLTYKFSLCFHLKCHKCFTKLQLINLIKRQIVNKVGGKFILSESLPFTNLSPSFYLSCCYSYCDKLKCYVESLVTNSMKYCNLEETIQDLLDQIYELANDPKYRLYMPKDNLSTAQWMGYFLYRKFNQDT